MKAHMAWLQSLCELAIAIVHYHCAVRAAALDGANCPLYVVNAECWPEGISAGPLNERHARVYNSRPEYGKSDGECKL